MSRPAPLWGGSALHAWLLAGGTPARSSPLLSRWRARAFEAARWLQQRLPQPPALAADPLFLLGLWRSGTTLAHGLVAALPGTATPHSWECFRPASFRLTAPPADHAGIARPMDDAMIAPSSPQEDEFALLLLGADSLYRGFLDPRRLPALAPLLDGADGDSWHEAFAAFLSGVLARRPGLLLVKSPNHLFRLASIRRHHPAARHLVLLRNANALYWSNLGMWTSMVDRYGHWPAPEGAIPAFVAEAMRAAADRFDELAAMAAAGAPVVAVRFEALVADPVATLAPLLPRLGLPADARAVAAMARRAAALKGTPRSAPRPLAAAAQDAATRLDAAAARLLAASGG